MPRTVYLVILTYSRRKVLNGNCVRGVSADEEAEAKERVEGYESETVSGEAQPQARDSYGQTGIGGRAQGGARRVALEGDDGPSGSRLRELFQLL